MSTWPILFLPAHIGAIYTASVRGGYTCGVILRRKQIRCKTLHVDLLHPVQDIWILRRILSSLCIHPKGTFTLRIFPSQLWKKICTKDPRHTPRLWICSCLWHRFARGLAPLIGTNPRCGFQLLSDFIERQSAVPLWAWVALFCCPPRAGDGLIDLPWAHTHLAIQWESIKAKGAVCLLPSIGRLFEVIFPQTVAGTCLCNLAAEPVFLLFAHTYRGPFCPFYPIPINPMNL